MFLGAHASTAQAQGRPVPKADECITDVSTTPVGQPRMVQCQGGTFQFFLTVPDVCARQGGCGLIYSGGGLAVSRQQDEENLGLSEAARNLRRPFIVITSQRPIADPMINAVFAGAIVNFIDISPMGLAPQGAQTELVSFITRAAKVFAVDMNRIHAGGFSQTAQGLFNIVCNPQQASIFASFALHASAQPGTAPTQTPDQACFGPNRSNPNFAPILILSGMTDGIVPPMNVAQTVQDIVTAKSLTNQRMVDSGTGFTQMRFRGAGGLELQRILYNDANMMQLPIPGAEMIRLLGHCYVGPVTRNIFSCEGAGSFKMGQKILEFYMDHPKR